MIPAATEIARVGPYQLIKAIGAGGSARIDLARIDRAYGFQRHVVIKRLLEHLRGDPRAAASLQREARLGARLRHPNLIAILDAGIHDGYDYLALEYVHGGSLRTLMQVESPSRVRDVPLAVALAIAADIARGLHAAHELADDHGAPLGLVHRDVSPGNILISLDGAVKLADFGIAKETRIQTLSGSMHGTVRYMAPEQCRGHAFDRRADVFSLGVILYELLTGSRLFWADNDVASLHRVLSGDVPRPRKIKPSISPALEDIVMTAIAHDQVRRFATARDVADALDAHAGEVGEILGARWIARWVHELIGPREVPWIGSPTMPDVAAALAARETSLVEIIDAVPVDDSQPDPTFGPTLPDTVEEIDTQPRRDPPVRKRRKGLIAAVALGLAGGVAGTVLVMSGASEPPPTTPAIPSSSEPRPASKAEPATASSPTPTPTAVEPPTAAERPTDVPSTAADEPSSVPVSRSTEPPRRRSTGRRITRTAPTATAPTAPTVTSGSATVVPVTPPPPVAVKPAAGSGSQRSNGVWSDKMLLPTDVGSGKPKK